MNRDIDIYREPFALDKGGIAFVGCIILTAGGLFWAYLAWGYFRGAAEGLPTVIAVGALLMGIAAAGLGLFIIVRMSIDLCDRSVQLRLTDEGLIDFRAKPERLVYWTEIANAYLTAVTIRGGRVGAPLTLTFHDGGQRTMQLLDLDREPEAILGLIEARVAAAREVRLHQEAKGLMGDLLPEGLDDVGLAGKRRCGKCGGLSPGHAPRCYHCGVEMAK